MDENENGSDEVFGPARQLMDAGASARGRKARRTLSFVVTVGVGVLGVSLILVLTPDRRELRDAPIDASTDSPPGDADALRREALSVASNAIRRIGRNPQEYNLGVYGYDVFGKKGWWFYFDRKSPRRYDGGDNEMDVLVLPDGSVSINGMPPEHLCPLLQSRRVRLDAPHDGQTCTRESVK